MIENFEPNPRKTSKNHAIIKIKNLIQEGILDIIDLGDSSRSNTSDLSLLMRDVGEESLLHAIVQKSKEHPKVKHIFVTNDQRALKRANELGLNVETIIDYLNHLTDYRIIECGRALCVAEIALSKISEYRNKCYKRTTCTSSCPDHF